jgi:hypothetical protein
MSYRYLTKKFVRYNGRLQWLTRVFAIRHLDKCTGTVIPIEIRRIIDRPEYREVQRDGRIRVYGFSASLGQYLRIVLLSDGETVDNAFPDEAFTP